MTDTTTAGAHSAIRVLAALAELGETTAAAIADHTALGYSTVTPKLRTWENTGQAERFRTDEGRTMWRLTAAGRAATAVAEPDSPIQAEVTPSDTGRPEPAADADTDVDAVAAAQPGSEDAGTPADDVESADAVHVGTGVQAQSEAAPAAVDDQPPTADPGAAGDNPPSDPIAAPADDTMGHEGGDPTTSSPSTGTADNDEPADGDQTTPVRRAPGSMRAAVLDICKAHPERQYKVGELCKLIDAANAGTDAKKASQGAVYNACTKLAAAGTLTQTVDKPATFRLTPTSN